MKVQKVNKKISGLYLILDQQYTKRDIILIAEEAAAAGVDIIQYREKVLSKKANLEIAKRIRDITHKAGVLFIINDDPALALAVDADGVHLGQEDIPVDVARKIIGKQKLIGLSTHSLEEVLEASRLDVDYIGFGPILHSTTKTVTTPHGIEGIKKVRRHISVPIIAIGGISHENAAEVMSAGADGAAVISAILSATDINQAISEIKEYLK